jgi:ABC-type uncharacterized transport system permease subunit
MDPAVARLGLRRLVGKFTLFLALIYTQIMVTGAVMALRNDSPAPVTWLLLLTPAIAFVPAVVSAVNLHRTSDQQRVHILWRRCALLATTGTALMIAAALILREVNS